MKFIQSISLLFFILLSFSGLAQNEIKFDTIQLVSGAKLPITLMIDEADVLNLSIINYIDEEGDPGELQLANTSKIIKYGGKVIYPKPEVKIKKVEPVVEKKIQKPKCNSQRANEIKLNINTYVQNRVNKIKQENNKLNTTITEANNNQNEKIQLRLYESIFSSIMKFECTNASLVSHLEILVDENGKFESLNSDISHISKASFYDNLEESDIIPFLKNYEFEKITVNISVEEEYNKLYTQFYEEMKNTNCDLSEFDYALRIAKMELEKLKNNNFGKRMKYRIPLNYSFTNEMQLWKLKKNVISMKNNSEMILTDEGMRRQFFEKAPSKNNGTYEVTVCTSELLGKEISVTLSNIKKRKNKWAKIGGIATIHPNTDLTAGGDNINLEGQYFYSAHLILNRIGFFYGSNYTGDPMPIKKNGLFISDNSKYHEGGMYFGMSNSLFLKLGYQNFSGKLDEFDINGINTNNNKYSQSYTQSGIVAGLALVFPVVHVEAGYNYLFDSFYAGAGINIPIKMR